MTDKLKNCRVFVFDLDGTLYLGEDALPGAHEIISGLEQMGKNYIYLTNNSSRSTRDYITRLRKLGFPCETENMFSSGMATAMFLNEHFPQNSVYLVGTQAFKNELLDYGICICEEDADVVCVGFDTELYYEKLRKAANFLRRGAAFIAANPDFVCPMPGDEVLPDCGSICALLTASTGLYPKYIGKPNREMIDIISAKTSVPNENIAVIGDRLYTDIAAGVNAGAVSVCVLSGETNREMISSSPVKPDYIFPSVSELLSHLKR